MNGTRIMLVCVRLYETDNSVNINLNVYITLSLCCHSLDKVKRLKN